MRILSRCTFCILRLIEGILWNNFYFSLSSSFIHWLLLFFFSFLFIEKIKTGTHISSCLNAVEGIFPIFLSTIFYLLLNLSLKANFLMLRIIYFYLVESSLNSYFEFTYLLFLFWNWKYFQLRFVIYQVKHPCESQ